MKWRIVALPKDKRTASLAELRDVARTTIQATVPGARVVVTDPPFVEGAATEAPIMVQVRAPDYDTLAPLAKQFETALKGVPGITDVDMKYTPGQPELRVAVDRDRAARAGRSRRDRRARAPRRHRGRRGRQAPSGQGRRPDPRAPRQGATARRWRTSSR